MTRNQRRMAAYNAKKAAEATDANRFGKKLTVALSGCSLNVSRATSSPSLREKHESSSVCLADVALYQAGHRKVRKEAVHITK